LDILLNLDIHRLFSLLFNLLLSHMFNLSHQLSAMVAFPIVDIVEVIMVLSMVAMTLITITIMDITMVIIITTTADEEICSVSHYEQ
jgi:hypothetical protein